MQGNQPDTNTSRNSDHDLLVRLDTKFDLYFGEWREHRTTQLEFNRDIDQRVRGLEDINTGRNGGLKFGRGLWAVVTSVITMPLGAISYAIWGKG